MNWLCWILGHRWAHFDCKNILGRINEKYDRCLRCQEEKNYVRL